MTEKQGFNRSFGNAFSLRGYVLANRARLKKELLSTLVDIEPLCASLGIEKSPTERKKWMCPRHQGSSLSLRIARDGLLQVRCFGCDLRGDALNLIAEARHLDIRSDFIQVLRAACEISNRWDLLGELGPERRVSQPALTLRHNASPSSVPLATASLDAAVFHDIAVHLLERCPLRSQADVSNFVRSRGVFADAEARDFGALPSPHKQNDIVEHIIRQFGEENVRLTGLLNSVEGLFCFPSHRLIIPWRGPDGGILSLQRRLIATAADRTPKYIFPRGRSLPLHPFGSELYADTLAYHQSTGRIPEIAFTESAFDALALGKICRERDIPRIVLGLPSSTCWRLEWALYAKGMSALVATDADKAGDEAASRIARDLWRAWATSVVRIKPAIDFKDFSEFLARAS